MTNPLFDLESLLQQLIVEHRKLSRHLEAQQIAMKSFALDQMDAAANQQDASRRRIMSLEGRRREILQQMASQHRLTGDLSIARLAAHFPQRSQALLGLRGELKKAIGEIQARIHIAGRMAAAVLGHLNTVVRLLAGAVERAGVYTKQGVPRIATRVGVMEAVG